MSLRELKIEITDSCPLRCIHCSTGAQLGLRSFVSLSDMGKMIGQAVELGCRKVLFSGGEPLFHPHLETFIEHCHSKRLQTKLYSSGIESAEPLRPVSLERQENLKAKGLRSAAFSLYASGHHIHDLMTNSEGSFAATLEAIQNAVRVGIRTEVHFVATKMNIDELVRLAEFLPALGVRHISVLRFVPQGRGKHNSEELTPTGADFLKLREIIAAIRKASQVSLRLGSPFNFLLLGSPSPCTTGTDRMIIDAHGLAHPCDALKQIALADRFNNALTTPLRRIMDEDPLFRLVRQSCTSLECKACPDFTICKGGCLAQSILANVSSPAGRDPACLRNVAEGVAALETLRYGGEPRR